MSNVEYDAIVVGSGPNGLSAAIRLQQEGYSVLILEGKATIGGGARTEELTLTGFHHDVCSAVHPMAAMSPFFKTLPLQHHGLEWLYPEISAAHPFDDGSAAALYASLDETVANLGVDGATYRSFMKPVVDSLPELLPGLLSPFPDFSHFFKLSKFGIRALPPSSWVAKIFKSPPLKGLWAGMAGHSIQPLDNWLTSAIGMMLMGASHVGGWPIQKGGSHQITKSLGAYFESIGGKIQTNFWVKKNSDLPRSKAVLFDVTPRQLLDIVGEKLPQSYQNRMRNYRYGMGVYKVDWAVSEAVPFTSEVCKKAGTVHLGGTFEEVAFSEKEGAAGRIVDKPFVLLSQPSIIDETRAPEGKQTIWAYCHVPHGSKIDRLKAIEDQVERFAPGFRDTILATHTFNANELESYNPNYVGGDINGGIQDIFQHFSRPILSLSPYRTPTKGIYICSSSTPPGGGVHGMCGFHAAERLLKDRIL